MDAARAAAAESGPGEGVRLTAVVEDVSSTASSCPACANLGFVEASHDRDEVVRRRQGGEVLEERTVLGEDATRVRQSEALIEAGLVEGEDVARAWRVSSSVPYEGGRTPVGEVAPRLRDVPAGDATPVFQAQAEVLDAVEATRGAPEARAARFAERVTQLESRGWPARMADPVVRFLRGAPAPVVEAETARVTAVTTGCGCG